MDLLSGFLGLLLVTSPLYAALAAAVVWCDRADATRACYRRSRISARA